MWIRRLSPYRWFVRLWWVECRAATALELELVRQIVELTARLQEMDANADRQHRQHRDEIEHLEREWAKTKSELNILQGENMLLTEITERDRARVEAETSRFIRSAAKGQVRQAE